MLRNYFRTAIRNISRNKLHAFINIFGLSVGISIGIIIIAYVTYEFSYDRFLQDSERIYRVIMNEMANGEESIRATAYPNFHRELYGTYPEIEASTRLMSRGFMGTQDIVRAGERIYPEQRVYYGDSTFFDVFSYGVLNSIKNIPLKGKGNAVITRSAALRYFNTLDVAGRSFRLNEEEEFTVTAVMEDIPDNSHYHFDILLSMDSHYWEQQANWNGGIFSTYFLLKEGIDPVNFQADINQFIKNHEVVGPHINDNFWMKVVLQPMEDIHLNSHYEMELESNGSRNYTLMFLLVSIFIILIACVNYINLETARSMERAREVGMRKIFGAGKNSLIFRFLGESFITVMMAFILSLGFIEVARPFFNMLVGIHFDYKFFLSGINLYLFLSLIPVIALLAGLYPALILSAYKPKMVLKGRLKSSRSGIIMRRNLVVFQFILSTLLIIGTLVIYKQINFIRNANLGITRDQLIVIPMNTRNVKDKRELIKSTFSEHTSIISGSAVSQLPINVTMSEGVSFNTGYSAEDPILYCLEGDRDLFRTLDMEILYGEGFTNEYSPDYTGYLLNESGMKLLNGNPETILEMDIRVKHGGLTLGPVIGVVKNFNFTSLQQEIAPLVICQNPGNYQYLLFKLNTENIKSTLSYMQNTWQELFPEIPFDYRFMDQDYEKMYVMEAKAGNIVLVFTLMAIFLAFSGLFGLSSYSTLQRTKEVGIRKVLGSSISQVVGMFIIENSKLVLISILIAIPLGYIIMDKWLESYAFKIKLGPEIFLLSISIVMAVTLLAILFHAIKAGLKNPVDTLRYE